ncbi:MAG: DUF4384 domain-containing protein [Nanoarchaeota archaeon]|nr:DUF4384 domain-containing protein [Nanoarchaeota archaeon]
MNKWKIIIGLIFISSCTLFTVRQEKDIDIDIIDEIMQSNIKVLGDDWYEVTGYSYIRNITPEEATNIAISNACQAVIEFYSGIEVSNRSLYLYGEKQDNIPVEIFSTLCSETAKGIIIEKKIVQETTKTVNSNLIKEINLKIKVGKQNGEKDLNFNLDASLDRDYLKNGEEISLTIISSKDCYLSVLNICSNDSVYIIFPNQFRTDNFIQAGKRFSVPNEFEREIGITYPVNLLPGKTQDVEAVKIIATIKKIDLLSPYSLSLYGTRKSALVNLQKWLIQIPRDEIEEVDLQYHVVE